MLDHAAAADDRRGQSVAGFDILHQGRQVRTVIGAALQEAALDPILHGREHLLPATLQGLPRASA